MKRNKVQVEPAHYYDELYDDKERFISYWHQIDELRSLNSSTVLEVGIGNGFVSDYLKRRGFDITTMDVDERLAPDIVGSVLEIPFKEDEFEAVACFETLEHLPYEDFSSAMNELHRVAGNHVVLSLPDAKKVYRFELHARHVFTLRLLIPKPRLRRPTHEFDGQHYWEIGKRRYPLDRVKGDIKRAGFEIEKTYRIFEFPYHRFFVLKALNK